MRRHGPFLFSSIPDRNYNFYNIQEQAVVNQSFVIPDQNKVILKFIHHLGYTSGGHYIYGSGASLVCLPETPSWNKYHDQTDINRGYIYGAELDHETGAGNVFGNQNSLDMPCAVCMTPHSVTHMFPGRNGCLHGWVEQYTGYLVSGMHGRSVDLEYYCLDAHPETVLHGDVDHNQCVLYAVEAHCGALPCPPYVEGREIACMVCSK